MLVYSYWGEMGKEGLEFGIFFFVEVHYYWLDHVFAKI